MSIPSRPVCDLQPRFEASRAGQRRRRRRSIACAITLVAGTLGGAVSTVLSVQPAAALTFVAVSAGATNSCGITPTGAAMCWGLGADGALGNGLNASSSVPVQVTGLTTGVTAISVGYGHVCAIVASAAKCWGYNADGGLGDGTTNNALLPVDVVGLNSGVTSISAGDFYTCAVVAGSARCWGFNLRGQLGNATSGLGTESSVPVQVSGLTSGVDSIDVGGGHSCATVGGAAKCWGNNFTGQLGIGTSGSSANTNMPVQVSGLTAGVTSISVGAEHTCAVVGGAAQCWGRNTEGRLGNSTTTNASLSVSVTGLASGVTSIAAGGTHTCAVVAGAAMCWGANTYGQLGNASNTSSNVAVPVATLASGVVAITTGATHSCANTATTNYCWGQNTSLQIGNGSNVASYNVPVSLDAPNGRVIYARPDLLSTTSVRIRWTATTTNESGFLVYRVLGTQQTQVACPTTTPNLTDCVDTGLTPGTHYQYYVYAWNASGTNYPGTYILVRTPDLAPLGPTVTQSFATGPTTATIGWIDNSNDETGFHVFRYNAGSYTLVGTAPVNATSAAITDATMNTASAQIFVVTSFNAAGETYGDTYTFTLARSAPSGGLVAPAYQILSGGVTANSAQVAWIDQTPNESGYQVYRVTGATQTLVPGCDPFTPTLFACTDTGLTPGTFYQYHVYAWNNTGIGYPGTGMVIHTPRPLGAPRLTGATGNTATTAVLYWSDTATDETSFNVYEYVNGGYTLVSSVGANVTSVQVTGLTPNTLHVYVVAAVRGTEIAYSTYGLWATTTSS